MKEKVKQQPFRSSYDNLIRYNGLNSMFRPVPNDALYFLVNKRSNEGRDRRMDRSVLNRPFFNFYRIDWSKRSVNPWLKISFQWWNIHFLQRKMKNLFLIWMKLLLKIIRVLGKVLQNIVHFKASYRSSGISICKKFLTFLTRRSESPIFY